jgi:hypothetical protein
MYFDDLSFLSDGDGDVGFSNSVLNDWPSLPSHV